MLALEAKAHVAGLPYERIVGALRVKYGSSLTSVQDNQDGTSTLTFYDGSLLEVSQSQLRAVDPNFTKPQTPAPAEDFVETPAAPARKAKFPGKKA